VRPTELADVLRYAEYLAVSETSRISDTVAMAFGGHVRPVAAKLLADICGFLVTAAGLRPEFRAAARQRLVIDLTGGNPAETTPTAAKADDDPAGLGEESAERTEASQVTLSEPSDPQ
jgi:hypothetical protein